MSKKQHGQRIPTKNPLNGEGTDHAGEDGVRLRQEPSNESEQVGDQKASDRADHALLEELADVKDKLLRSLAEAENVRRRADRDLSDARQYAISKFATDILGVADNLDRALGSVNDKERQMARALIDGIEMTRAQLLATLEKHGVNRIEPEGERFDPNYHEALFEVADPTKPTGTISSVVEPGYMLGNRPLRPAKVGIAKNDVPNADQDTK